VEVSRLITVFASDLTSLERGYKRAADLEQRYVREAGRGFKQLEQNAGRAFQTIGRQGEQSFAKLEKDARSVSSRISGALSSIKFGGIGGGGGGGLLPGLSNISSIIRGIPQVGQLIGALVSPFTEAAEAGIRYNMTLENARIGLEGVAGSAEKANKHIKELQTFGERTPFEFTGLLKASRYMTTFGFGLREQIPLLTSWGNAVAASGDISEEALTGVIRAFGQMRALQRVNSEEMSQLAERGIPSWELLAKAIGKSVAETRKLGELGKLNGPAAVRAITAMMDADPRFKGQMDRMSRTLTGRLSNLEDIKGRALGIGTEALTKNLSDSLEESLKRADLAETMGRGFNAALAPVGALIHATVKATLGGGITGGLSEGLQAGFELIGTTMPGWITKFVINPAQTTLKSQSPSRVFHDIGFNAALGFAEGFSQEGAAVIELNIKEVIERLQARFKELTGRALKIAIGQTGTHNRLGFDHTRGADIAVDPKSADAATIKQILDEWGVPYLMQPGAKRNASGRVTSTGPHIHVGPLSPNFSGAPIPVGTFNPSPLMRVPDPFVVSEAGRPTPVRVTNFGEMPTPVSGVREVVSSNAVAPAPLSLPHGTLPKGFADAFLQPTLIGDQQAEAFKRAQAAAGTFYKDVVTGGKKSWLDLRGSFEESFGGMYQYAGEGFKGMARGFLLDWAQMIQQMAMQKLAQGFGEMIFGKLIPALGAGLFGISGLPSFTPGSGITTGPTGTLGGLPGREFGGPVNAGELYRVNERGRGTEVFRPRVSGEVIPLRGGARSQDVLNYEQHYGHDFSRNTTNNYSQPRVQEIRHSGHIEIREAPRRVPSSYHTRKTPRQELEAFFRKFGG
jgi:tape measure domain-containing protein